MSSRRPALRLPSTALCESMTALSAPPMLTFLRTGAHRQKKALRQQGRRDGVLVHYARNAEERDNIFQRALGPNYLI